MKNLFFFLVIIIIPVSLFAQPDNTTEHDRNVLSERIAQLNDYLQFISDSQRDMNTRLFYVDQIKELFIANGNTYEELITDTIGQTQIIQREGVAIEVSSLRRPHPAKMLLRNYLSGLVNHIYQQIEVQGIEIAEVDVSSLRRIENNQYECICYFDRKYCGSRDGKPLYQDITRRKVRTIIELSETERNLSTLYLFGDIRAISKQ